MHINLQTSLWIFFNSTTLLLTKLTISTCFKNLDIMLFNEWTLFVYRPKFHRFGTEGNCQNISPSWTGLQIKQLKQWLLKVVSGFLCHSNNMNNILMVWTKKLGGQTKKALVSRELHILFSWQGLIPHSSKCDIRN